MLGFFTVVSLIIAFALGGWWWAGFALLFLAWLGKRGEGKAQREDERATLSGDLVSDDWPPELITACSSLTSHGYYVGALIPEKKRVAAMANYPPPGDGQILALIDATVFGSATKGLAVGRDGISWKNGSEPAVKISWNDLARHDVSSGDHKVSLGNLDFDNSGSGIKLDDVQAFILRLQAYAIAVTSSEDAPLLEVEMARPKTTRAVVTSQPVVAINFAEFDELLALPGIGAAEAQMIIKRRGKQSFSSNAELGDYLDLKPHIVARLDGLTEFMTRPVAPLSQVHEPQQPVRTTPKRTTLTGRTID